VIHWSEPQELVGLAVIDRQERRNALNAQLCDELRARLEAGPRLRAVVITGEGVAFCAGADLARRAADTSAAGGGAGGLEHGGGDSFRPAFERLLDAIVAFPAPVIAAVNGPALGAGMQLAVACDLRVVAHRATFGIPAARLGVVLSAANVRRLAQLVGLAAARDLLLTGRTLDFDESARLGLVHRAGDDARAGGLALAAELASLAPLTVQGHKRALNLVAAAGALDGAALDEIAALETGAFASSDLQEGIAAFAEKRAPTFRGQ
jgi:enoyl-CoA hydratase